MKETEDTVASFANKIRERKLKKFERDTRDYNNNNVYKFLRQNSEGAGSTARKRQFPGLVHYSRDPILQN